ncbi:MAG: RsmE family RNA methyltransferase [Candidatus Paceibacterota bacterium]|jgi:16S rRNA (uracil1498-N3)-methyltransferase
MRLHRFYIPTPIGSDKNLRIESEDMIHQIRKVFRLGVGDKVIVFDGSGFDYICEILETEKSASLMSLQVSEIVKSRFMPERQVVLAAALVKKDNFEWIAEKATELGISRIIPVVAERSEKKFLNEDRLQKILIEASEQSGRGNIPTLEKMIDFSDAVSMSIESKIVFHTEGEKWQKETGKDSGPVMIFIGPEGGWSDAELEMFQKYNIPTYCLGSQILRAETAVVAALSQVVF